MRHAHICPVPALILFVFVERYSRPIYWNMKRQKRGYPRSIIDNKMPRKMPISLINTPFLSACLSGHPSSQFPPGYNLPDCLPIPIPIQCCFRLKYLVHCSQCTISVFMVDSCPTPYLASNYNQLGQVFCTSKAPLGAHDVMPLFPSSTNNAPIGQWVDGPIATTITTFFFALTSPRRTVFFNHNNLITSCSWSFSPRLSPFLNHNAFYSFWWWRRSHDSNWWWCTANFYCFTNPPAARRP